MKYMSGPSGSSLSILGRYTCSYPIIVSLERSHYTRGSLGYSHSLGEIVITDLTLITNCEIAKIAVNTYRGYALNRGSFAGNGEAQPVPSHRKRAHLDSWLRDKG